MKKTMAFLMAGLMMLMVVGTCFASTAVQQPARKIQTYHSLTVIVKDLDGNLLPNSLVAIAGGHLEFDPFDIQVVIDWNWTDANGEYIFTIPNGQYTVCIIGPTTDGSPVGQGTLMNSAYFPKFDFLVIDGDMTREYFLMKRPFVESTQESTQMLAE